MRINIDLSKKSTENAIKQIKAVQKKVQTELPRVYLQKCVEWIKAEADKNLMATNIGSKVKSIIQSQWQISPVVGNKITLSNTAQLEQGKNLAVFVEFGVGVVGQTSYKEPDFQREAIAKSGYQYNVPSPAKSNKKGFEGQWSFGTSDGESYMNLEREHYETYDFGDGVLTIVTKGSPATMFLFKAWKTFETSGLYKTLWEQAKAEVIG